MRYSIILTAASLMLGLPLCARAADLDSTLAKAMEGTQTPAMAILMIQEGKVADTAARGVRRNDGADTVLPDDVWATGSDAKPMTAAMIARLVDRKVLSWNTPLSKMLPDLAKKMRPEYRKVTLADLLSHHAGFAHDVNDEKFIAAFVTDARSLPLQRLAYIKRALSEAPVVTPETTFSYSNTGFIVAAAIAERASHLSYEELMQREIFNPLGMNSARFAMTQRGQTQGHHAGNPINDHYMTADDGNPLMLAPAGAELHLTLRDWASFCIDQLDGAAGNGKLLSRESYRLMQTSKAGDNTALGWGVQPTIADRQGPVLTHAGSDGNWYALVALFPNTRSGVLVAANAGEDMGGDKAAKAAIHAVLPELSAEKQ